MRHPPSVFISYRREDCPEEARRLYEVFARRWGPDAIYFDTESNRLGEDFKLQIGQALSATSVVVAIVGPKWTQVQDGAGARRLRALDDWVREELFYAVRNTISLIPVFVSNAAIPKREELPDELIGLPDLHGKKIRQDSFELDADELMRRIEEIVRARLTTGGWRGPALALRLWIQTRLVFAARLARKTFFHVSLGVLIGGTWWFIKYRS